MATAPAVMAAEYATFDPAQNPDLHDRSYCIDFEDAQFTDTLVDPIAVLSFENGRTALPALEQP